jgi:cellulose synthase/poly-beta-1,6-N-acetylglucosamine synthase-like glycosyltransferase
VTGIVFDETFGSYVEDVDFCLRVADAGWKIGLATKAEAWELGSASPRAMTLIRANTVRLKVNRHGFPGGLAAISSLIVQGVRSGLGGIAPWRPSPQRRDSSNRCRACASALSLVVRPSFWSARTERTDAVLSKIEPSPRECQRSHPDLR